MADDVGHLAVELLVLGVLQFFSSVLSTIAKIGAAVLFTVGWNVAGMGGIGHGTLLEVAVYMTIQNMASNPLQAWQFRRRFDKSFVILVSILWGGSEAIGTQLLFLVGDSAWLKRSLGFMLLGVFIYETSNFWSAALGKGGLYLWPRRAGADSPRSRFAIRSPTEVLHEAPAFSVWRPRDFAKSVVFALSCGFLKGLFNVPIIALLLFALYSGMSKEAWRANMSWVQLLVLPPKIYMLFVQKGLYDSTQWPWYLTSALASIVAVPFGDWIASKVDQAAFRQLVTIIMFLGALMLATSGSGLVSVFCILGLAGVGLIFYLAKWFCGAKRPGAASGGGCGPAAVPAGSDAAVNLDLAEPVVCGAGAEASPERRRARGASAGCEGAGEARAPACWQLATLALCSKVGF